MFKISCEKGCQTPGNIKNIHRIRESSLPDFFVNYLEKFQNRVEILFLWSIIYLEIFLNRW